MGRKFKTGDSRYEWIDNLEKRLEELSGGTERISVLDSNFANNIRMIDLTKYTKNTPVNQKLFQSMNGGLPVNDGDGNVSVTDPMFQADGKNIQKFSDGLGSVIADDISKIDNMFDMAYVGNLFIMVPIRKPEAGNEISGDNDDRQNERYAMYQITLSEDDQPVVSDINQLEFEQLPSKAQKFWRAIRGFMNAIAEYLFVSKDERERRAENRRDIRDTEMVDSIVKKFVESNADRGMLEEEAKKSFEKVAKGRAEEFDDFDRLFDESEHDNYIEEKVGKIKEYLEEGENALVEQELLKVEERDTLIKYYNDLRDELGEECAKKMDKIITNKSLEKGMDEKKKAEVDNEIDKISYHSGKASEYLNDIRTKAMNRTLFSATIAHALGIGELKEYYRGGMDAASRKSFENKLKEMEKENPGRKELLDKVSNYAAYGKEKKDCLDLMETALWVCTTGEYAKKYGCNTEITLSGFGKAAVDILPKVEGAVMSYLEGDKKELCKLMAESLGTFGEKMINIGNNEEMAMVFAEGMNQTLLNCKKVMGDDYEDVVKEIKDFPKIKAYTGIVNESGRGYNVMSSILRMATDVDSRLNAEKQLGKSITELLFRGEISRRMLKSNTEDLNKCIDKLAEEPDYLDKTMNKLKQTNSFKRFSQMKPAEAIRISSTPEAMDKIYSKAMGELKDIKEVKNDNSNKKLTVNQKHNEPIQVKTGL